MVQNQKTPTEHNSTLYISPMVNKKNDLLYVTPPNPTTSTNKLLDTPGSNKSASLFFNFDKTSQHNAPHHDISHNSLEDPLTPVDKLRLWRHDAIMQHQYKTAEFIGDKILELTTDPNDAFWLAQVYFNQGNYLRCKNLITSNAEYNNSISCRYLAGYSLIKLEMWEEALDLIGETNPFKNSAGANSRVLDDGGIKLEASMCYLRGLIYANQNNFERAKECYKEACVVDVKCYEAFNELIDNNLMTPTEEWDFVMTQLNYRDNLDNNDELIKLLYTTKLSKYLNTSKFEESEHILKEEYELHENCDLMLSRADYLYIQCNFDECLSICERILNRDQYNFDVIPNYLSCLYELGGKNKLFLKAHQLAELHPTNPMTWLAIGTYYLSINKVVEARKFFSKATLLNPNFGQAWIGFAHTFAAEGEHEQAISAYAYAARLFPGTHLPNLFLGMQHLQMNNLNLLEEYLLASYHICNSDPLLLNELGVINFHKNQFDKAEMFLQEALTAAKNLNSDSKTWISIHANLGHVYRRANQPYKALDCFNQVLKISNKNDANILSAIGLIHLRLGNIFKSIDILHDALAISPLDPVASDLLKRALEANKENKEIFSTTDKLLQLILPSDGGRIRRRTPGRVLKEKQNSEDRSRKDNKLGTPLTTKTRVLEPAITEESSKGEYDDVTLLAQDLQQGEVSSEDDEEEDEDDEDVMDIVSD
ncbi:Anaphase-promoting complex subunit cut9 [Candida viswanathii]|uniref:Anaphase-promoting complex subunit cut9 n=1 Tax=Candida viswanathii TaxID=5486 RepID=A0A367XS41_9ASCO|nr:Anaphase-promoting complex subunit cut9 [Candida viswanathii]